MPGLLSGDDDTLTPAETLALFTATSGDGAGGDSLPLPPIPPDSPPPVDVRERPATPSPSESTPATLNLPPGAMTTVNEPPAAPETKAGPGFFERLSRGIGKAGMVLGGGDPALYDLTPDQQRAVGIRSLLQTSLSMLANSGPSYTPRNFGQILAAGLEAGSQVAPAYEQALAARADKQTELALKKGALDVQKLTASVRLAQLRQALATLQGGQQSAKDALHDLEGGGGGTGGGGGGGDGAPSLTPFVAPNLPSDITPAEDQMVRTVWGESNGQPLAGQQAVAHVIRNRANQSGETTEQVIFKRNQFEPWNTGRRKDLEALPVDSPQYQAILKNVVRPVMNGTASDPTGGATYFLNPDLVKSRGDAIPAWATGNETRIGAHTFFYGPYGGGGGGRGGGGRVQVAGPYSGGGGGGGGDGGATTQQTPPAPNAAPSETQPGNQPPAELPAGAPAAAPDTPEIAKARQDARANAARQLRALAAQPRPDTGDKVVQVRKELADREAELDKEARAYQDKIATERRTQEAKIAEEKRIEEREARQKQLENDLALKREQALQEQRAKDEAAKSYQTAALNVDTDRLKKLAAQSDAATAKSRDVQALAPFATRMGPASKLADTTIGRHLRDLAVAYKLGDDTTIGQYQAQQGWDHVIHGLFQDTHVQGIGSQSDREGEWIMSQFGGVGQTPDDRLTQLAVVRKLAQQRQIDNELAQRLFNGPDKSLKNFDAQRNKMSVFDRPPMGSDPDKPWQVTEDDKENAQRQNSYVHSHPPGEPFQLWMKVEGNDKPQLFWARNQIDGTTKRLARVTEGPQSPGS